MVGLSQNVENDINSSILNKYITRKIYGHDTCFIDMIDLQIEVQIHRTIFMSTGKFDIHRHMIFYNLC